MAISDPWFRRAIDRSCRSWPQRQRGRHQRPADLVAQDGLTPDAVPWQDIAALFVGGSTAWKEGPAAVALIQAAKAHGCWVHVGRINTERRLRYFDALGIDSFDGTQFSMFAETYLPRWLERLCYRQHALIAR